MLKITPLETDALIGVYDEVKRLFVLLFRGSLTVEVNQTAQTWFDTARAQLGERGTAHSGSHGVICDLRQVTLFGDRVRLDTDEQPVAFVVSNSYQERIIGIGQTDERRRVLRSLDEAFQFTRQYNRGKRGEIVVLPVTMIDTDHVSCHYHYDDCIVCVQYYGALTAEVTGQVFAWLTRMFECCGADRLIGAIFDYRAVTQFAASNVAIMQRSSTALNTAYDLTHVAVPIIVCNQYQEQMARLAMRVTKDEPRRVIVPTMRTALEFVSTYHTDYLQSKA